MKLVVIRHFAFLLAITSVLGSAFIRQCLGAQFQGVVRSSADMETAVTKPARLEKLSAYDKKINFIYRPVDAPEAKTLLNQQTPTPEGWESYDGSIYSAARGYGWLTDLKGRGRDRGLEGILEFPDGTQASIAKLNRPELANFQGRHGENDLLVFRIDLPNGWYRVACASVDPHPTDRKPLVDQRSFKCRAHDVVFAGANVGEPVAVGGRRLIEGSSVVEATDNHLRIVIGDAAYGGWTWKHSGGWHESLKQWWRVEYNYANGWFQRLSRTVDPGFHTLSINSLHIERVAAPKINGDLVFRDFFNREDDLDVNAGIAATHRWRSGEHPSGSVSSGRFQLYKTAIKFDSTESRHVKNSLLQQRASPAAGTIRYSTRVSLFTGAGSQKHKGVQEAGIVLLADPSSPSEYSSTFVGIRFDGSRALKEGSVIYRVGNGQGGFKVDFLLADTLLPFKVREGEFEILATHDVKQNYLSQIAINGVDITAILPLRDRAQRISRGLFGIRGLIDNRDGPDKASQFYWFYRVEDIGTSHRALQSAS
jgi:hypothetical protein